MYKSDIEDRVAVRLGLNTAVAKDAVDGVLEAINEALANGEKVQILDFATFDVRKRPARTGRNQRRGESVSIAASTVPVLKPGKALRDAVDGDSGLAEESGHSVPVRYGMLKSCGCDAKTGAGGRFSRWSSESRERNGLGRSASGRCPPSGKKSRNIGVVGAASRDRVNQMASTQEDSE